ncbi:MAG: hypothetical protein E7618_06690 [Ruminococcaceae bacterium]|nr:hypothetical protein [Oscillospiraceae bacterium]
MAIRNWTPSQLAAITATDHDILVSAAAGSGKTAVLTQRIIQKLTDPDHPADISRMLIVTYTKAAAGELKERISKAVSAAMAENPGNKRLRRQYVLLGRANITTIHGFCLDLVRQNFERLGLSPAVSVSDATQTNLLRRQVADAVIESYYSSLPGYDDIEDFISFADNFITLRDSRLSDILLGLYEKISSYPQGVSFFEQSADEYQKIASGDFYATRFGEFLLLTLADQLRYYAALLKDACDCFDCDVFRDKYYPAFLTDYATAKTLLGACESRDISAIRQALGNYTPGDLSSVKKELQNEETLFYKEIHGQFKALIQKITTSYFSHTDAEIQHTATESATFLSKLYRFLLAFDRRYRYEKRIRGFLDFSDLERYACELLTDSEGKPTALADSVSSHFDEIYIDEYQDVNKIQDMIFLALSRHASRFMVGDIKQSIYGFRGGEPSLFADYRLDPSVKKIYLSDNFRCDRPIIQFVNDICGELFTQFGHTVPYDETDALVCGKGGEGEHTVELHLLEKKKGSAREKRMAEAAFVADRIAVLIKEGASPGDICILLRSTSRASTEFAEALEAKGIRCHNDIKRNLFVNPEVLLAMNLLQVIDNPTRDIYLAGLLKSPLYHVTLSELIQIRKACPDGSLYDALRQYTASYGFGKGEHFLQKLAEYRQRANDPVDTLLFYLYHDTNLLSLVAKEVTPEEAMQKKANLLALYEHARSFESSTFKGLYHFIHYITDMLDAEADIPEPTAADDMQNTVRIMSIHQSKGLEFPIVFLSDTTGRFNDTDSYQSVLIDRHFGASLKLSDSTGLASIDTLFRRTEGLAISLKNADEEIRVLYVALTRAIHRLIVTGCVSDAEKKIADCHHLSRYSEKPTGYLYYENRSYWDWILIAAKGRYQPTVTVLDNRAEEEDTEAPISLDDTIFIDEEEVSRFMVLFRHRFAISEAQTATSALPAKLSVSELYPTILDEYDDALKLADTRKNNMRSPRFIAESDTSTDRGTATHLFMQFCDFDRLHEHGIDREIDHLLSLGYLEKHIATLIHRPAIERFLKSDLFPELRQADFIRRELRFNIRLPAAAFTADEGTRLAVTNESILVQGIMDCVFTDSQGRLTILDYKTDRIPKALMETEGAPEQFLIERHREQLSYYRAACERMFCRQVDRVLLYSFALGRSILVPFSELLDF